MYWKTLVKYTANQSDVCWDVSISIYSPWMFTLLKEQYKVLYADSCGKGNFSRIPHQKGCLWGQIFLSTLYACSRTATKFATVTHHVAGNTIRIRACFGALPISRSVLQRISTLMHQRQFHSDCITPSYQNQGQCGCIRHFCASVWAA